MGITLFRPTYRVDECTNEIKKYLMNNCSDYGEKCREFERKWKEYTKFSHALFLSSAIGGIQLAIKLLKDDLQWQDDDEIISSPLTFVATNQAISNENLKVTFADVDHYLCLNPFDVKQKINEKTKAIVFSGLGGNTGSYKEIVKICKENNLILLLDAAHMSGTRLNGEIVGKEADVVVYSFQEVNNMPIANASIVCFKEKKYDDIARKFIYLELNKDQSNYSYSKNKWNFDLEFLGNKYTGNSLMAIIGMVQLKYLDQDNAYRRQIAKWYDQEFRYHKNLVKPVPIPEKCESSSFLYIVQVNNPDDILIELDIEDKYHDTYYHDNTDYNMYAYGKDTCPNAHKVSPRILLLPMHTQLTKHDVTKISKEVIKHASL